MTPEELAEIEAKMAHPCALLDRRDATALCAEVRRLREIKCDKIDCARLEADRIEACRRAEKAEAEVARLRRASLPHMCRDGHEEIRHAGDDELCPVCWAKNEAERAREERDAALAQTYRLREALDAAQRIVRRKADREAGREEGDHVG